MFYLHVCICTTCVPGAFRSEEDVGSSGSGVYGWFLGIRCVWGVSTQHSPTPPTPTPTDACRGRGVRFPLGLNLELLAVWGGCWGLKSGSPEELCMFLRLWLCSFLKYWCVHGLSVEVRKTFRSWFSLPLFKGVSSGCQQQVLLPAEPLHQPKALVFR